MRCTLLLILATTFFQGLCYDSGRILTVGLQFKPIFPSELFNTGTIDVIQNDVHFLVELSPKVSFSGGMVIRSGINEKFSFETGINITQRDYNIGISYKDYSIEDGFRIIGYEVPVLGLLYIRLGENAYMNTAFGGSLDFYPSNIRTDDNFFRHYTHKKSWINPALLANIGWEFRTQSLGFYYIGASYHMPFTEIATTKVQYSRIADFTKEVTGTMESKLSGTYVTIDLRYFFPPKKSIRQGGE